MNELKRKSVVGPTSRINPPVKIQLQNEDSLEISSKNEENIPKAKTTNEVTEGQIKNIKTIQTSSEILCCKYTEDFEYIAAGFSDGFLRLYNLKTLELAVELNDRATTTEHTDVDGHIKCWNYNFLQCIYTIFEKRQLYGLTYHPRLAKFLTYGDDGVLCMYDEETRTQEIVFHASDNSDRMDGHQSRVFSSRFNPIREHEFVSGGWDDTIQFWDIRSPHSVRHFSGPHICGDAIDISHDGKEILTCGWQRETPIQLWDYSSGKLMINVEPDKYSSLLYSGKFIGKEFSICGGTDSNILRIINMRTFTTHGLVRELVTGVYCTDLGRVRNIGKSKAIEATHIPNILFCSGKNLHEITF